MEDYERLVDSNRRAEPPIWIERIVLFESIEPKVEIRKIKFGTGLNIVWGIENESANDQLSPGHGVGKTTLCRLIRFCLGESNFGRTRAIDEIRQTFSNGWVAAVVHVAGQKWSVIRPFAKNHASYAGNNTTIEQLIANRPHRSSHQEFEGLISRTGLHSIRCDSVLSKGADIQWKHLLALCSRDQEARYLNLWEWRSKRSNPDMPHLHRPKEDAFLCMRSLLGILPTEETDLQAKIQQLTDDVAAKENLIVERKREPQFWITHLRRRLQTEFEIADADFAPLDEGSALSLPSMVENRIGSLRSQMATLGERIRPMERQISMAGAVLLEPQELQEEEIAAADITDEGSKELAKTIEELRSIKESIDEARHSLCKYGRVLIGDCTHVQNIEAEYVEIRRTDMAKIGERDQISAALRERIERREKVIVKLRSQLDALNEQRRSLADEISIAKRAIESLGAILADLQKWESIQNGKVEDSEIAKLIKDRDGFAGEKIKDEAALSSLLSKQDESLADLRTVFDTLVKGTLSSDFKGTISLTNDGFDFRILRGESLSGEAFETLAILLADIALLLMGALDKAQHPGLLIHDSPREADLGAGIYRRLLETSAKIAEQLRGTAEIPFQYIVTTTSPPPKTLRGKGVTKLRLGKEHGLLFNRQLATEAAVVGNQLFSDVRS